MVHIMCLQSLDVYIRALLCLHHDPMPLTYAYFCHYTVLNINFQESDYSFDEADAVSGILVRFRRTQNPFTLRLFPVDITEGKRRVGEFITIPATTNEATAGECGILFKYLSCCYGKLEHWYLHACGSVVDEIFTLQARIPLVKNTFYSKE